jgi:hypothetical protein
MCSHANFVFHLSVSCIASKSDQSSRSLCLTFFGQISLSFVLSDRRHLVEGRAVHLAESQGKNDTQGDVSAANPSEVWLFFGHHISNFKRHER